MSRSRPAMPLDRSLDAPAPARATGAACPHSWPASAKHAATHRSHAAPAWRTLSAALLVIALTACGGHPPPQPAQFVPAAPAVAELQGPLRVHYNLLPTLALSEAVARQYGVRRSDGSALLVVALRRPGATAGDETPAEGQVRARARNLAGQQQDVAMRAVGTGEYIDHIGVVTVGTREVVRIEVEVEADGRRQQFDFQRSF